MAFASYLAWFWLVRHYPAGRLAAFTFLSPLVGMAAGPLMLGERITGLLAVAAALVAGRHLPGQPAAAGALGLIAAAV